MNKFKHLTSNVDLSNETHIIFAYNLFLDDSLDAKGGSASLKNHSLSKLLEVK